MVKNEINAGSLSPADTTNGSNGINSTSTVENSNMISTATANDAVCNKKVEKMLIDVQNIEEAEKAIMEFFTPFIESVEEKSRAMVEQKYPSLLRHWGKSMDELPKTVAHKFYYSNNCPNCKLQDWIDIEIPQICIELYDSKNFYEEGDYEGVESCRIKLNANTVGKLTSYHCIPDLWNFRTRFQQNLSHGLRFWSERLEKNYEDYDFLHYCEMVCDLGEREIKGGPSQRMRDAIAKWCVRFEQVRVCHPFAKNEIHHRI